MEELALNSHPAKRKPLNLVMPVYQYQVVKDDDTVELFEVEQGIQDDPLTKHPLTSEPVRRVVSAPSLTLDHSDNYEKKSLSAGNLHKNGFTQYEKDSSSGDYYKTAGNQGPDQISHDDIHKPTE
jgi:predicted nucleic acid-binding Zn ribbon protein